MKHRKRKRQWEREKGEKQRGRERRERQNDREITTKHKLSSNGQNNSGNFFSARKVKNTKNRRQVILNRISYVSLQIKIPIMQEHKKPPWN